MKYNRVNEEIFEKIRKVVSGTIYKGDEISKDFFHDEMPIYGEARPELVVNVSSTKEVSDVVKICYENTIPVLARGAGTGLTGAAVAISGGIIINMDKFDKILEYSEENLLVTVQPGVKLKDLQEDCSKKGYLYPPDPGEKSATIGGNVSTNAGGMRAVKYGTTRSYVREVEVVLPNGEITRFGAKVSKSSSGYSLLNLIIGSEGTLGIITEITLKLVPLPKYDISIIAPFSSIDDCIKAVPKLSMSEVGAQSIEFVERETVVYAEKYTQKKVFPSSVKGETPSAYLIVRFDGNDFENLLDFGNLAADICFKEGALEVLVSDTPRRSKELWEARASFLTAIEARSTLLDECDVVVPVSELAGYIHFLNSLKENYDFKVLSFGHAGDGNLHIYTLSNDMNIDEFKKQVDNFMHKLYSRACVLNGQISGEHGIGNGKKSYLSKYEADINVELMKGIKKIFDTKLILNPNKVLLDE